MAARKPFPPVQRQSRRGTRRTIDIREHEKIDERAFKSLIRAAVELNTSKRRTT